MVYIDGTVDGDSTSAFFYLILSYLVRNRLPTVLIQDLLIHVGLVYSDQRNPWLDQIRMYRSSECHSRQMLTMYISADGIRLQGTVLSEIGNHLERLSKDRESSLR